ncbi:hypothetical protein FRC10_000930 [Ceratobasidium sp. 414]|nr:hypothetical protein FRC10_000930 [Ceratobasidium sp. 414]
MHAWSKAKHNNVLQLLGAATFQDQFSLLSPWMVNGDLSNYLSKYPNVDRYPICAQIADGLAYLHGEGIVSSITLGPVSYLHVGSFLQTHGNITAASGNILISENRTVKLADYGCACLAEWSVSITTVSFLGSCNISWTATQPISSSQQITSVIDVPVHTNRAAIIHVGPAGLEIAGPQEPTVTRSKHGHMMRSLLENCWRPDPAARPDAENVQFALNDIQQEWRQSREALSYLGHNDIVSAFMNAFVDHGCLDLTPELDLPSCDKAPVAGGGFGDIYMGALKNNKPIAIKCTRIFINAEANHERSLKVELTASIFPINQLT